MVDPELIPSESRERISAQRAQGSRLEQFNDYLGQGVGAWQVDVPRQLISHNSAWLQFLGYQPSDLKIALRMSLQQWALNIEPSDRSGVLDQLTKPGSDQVFTFSYLLASIDGVQFRIESQGRVCQRDSQGHAVIIRGTHRCVDEQHMNAQVADQLQRHEMLNQLASILGYADLVSSKGHQDIAAFMAHIVQCGDRLQLLLAPETKTVSLHHLLDRFQFDVITDDPQFESLNLPSSIADDTLLDIIAAVESFISTHCTGPIKLQIKMSVRPDCSTCQLQQNRGFSELSFTASGLKLGHRTSQYLLSENPVSVALDNHFELMQSNNVLHRQGGHLTLAMMDSRLALKLYVPTFPNPAKSDPATFSPVTNTATNKPPAFINTRNTHILVVDDNSSVANIIAVLLTGKGYQVTTSLDSLLALECFNEQPEKYDLLITDQFMPGITGEVLSKAMRKVRPELPVILCSGDITTLADDKEAGVMSLAKPIDSAHLFRSVESLLA